MTSRPETFRLPKATERDPFFGLSRAFYYQGEQNNWWRLIRLRQRGKQRGVTLVPLTDAVLRFVQSQTERK